MPDPDPQPDHPLIPDLRLLISDVNDGDDQVFSDPDLVRFLSLTRGVKRAAALALTTIAANETLLLKHVTSRGITLDGPAVGKALRELAMSLRAEADTDDAADEIEDDAAGAFYIVGSRRSRPELTEPRLDRW